MTSPVRRSGRSRKVNTKYSNVSWSKETLRLLRESSESSNPTSASSNRESSQGDDEFDEQQAQTVLPDGGQNDDNLSAASASTKSSPVRTPEDDAEENDAEEDDANVAMSEGEAGTVTKRRVHKEPDQSHSRGIAFVERGRSVKGGAWQATFGHTLEDLRPMLEAKERWLCHARDALLPSWTTIEQARLNEWSKNKQDKNQESSSRICSETRTRQRTNRLSLEDAQSRLFLTEGIDHEVVLGPWSHQAAHELPYLKPVDVGQAWRKDKDSSDSSYHSGWLLNVGEKPQCLAWSPHQNEPQYLALVCRSTPKQRESKPSPQLHTSAAFSPSPSYPVGIQIWEFSTVQGSAQKSTMDLAASPRLVSVLGCSFGDIKQMKWVPESVAQSLEDIQTDLGMLALIATDGSACIISVPKSRSASSGPVCIEILSPMLKFNPPVGAVYTCLTFASPTDLILGTSSGYIHIYNISGYSRADHEAELYFTFQLHHTYVLALCTLDGDHSNILASTSAAGAIQLTDLRSPTQDVLTIPRARLPTRNLICNPHSRTFITTVDSSGNTESKGNAQTTVLAYNLRHFYATTALSKFPEGSGTATALAGSSLHPCILVGNSGGTVWTQNVVRRLLPTGKANAKNDGGSWVQKVVEYEWIPSLDSSVQPNASLQQTSGVEHASKVGDLYHGPPTRQGISRMHHGFRPEKLDLSNTGSKKRKVSAGGLNNETAVQVIFEEEQAVTAIEWNDNPTAAGWCAIGWGSGVVFITDLGHEAT